MTPPSDLRLPKFPVEVEVGLSDGSTQWLEFYVAEHNEHSYRRQHVLDLLHAEELFVPALEVVRDGGDGRGDGDGVWAMINKATIAWVAIPLDEGALPVEESLEAVDPELYDVRIHVSIEIVAHATVEGHVMYSPPSGHERLNDYLNRPGRFLRVWTGERLVLVNKSSILRVREPAAD